ncbi:MAG: hypothetical protein ACLPSY_18105 [Steroidobacteraceae bacterium]
MSFTNSLESPSKWCGGNRTRMKIAASAALKTQPNATKLPVVEFKEEVPYPAQLLPSFLAALIVHPFGTGRAVGTRGAIARMRIIGGFCAVAVLHGGHSIGGFLRCGHRSRARVDGGRTLTIAANGLAAQVGDAIGGRCVASNEETRQR